jgi:hypothetical protein
MVASSVPVGLAKAIADPIVSMAKATALSRTPSFRPDVVLNNWNWLKS